jgi:hypothetical protein
MEDIGKVIEEIYINFIRRSLKDINEASRRHKTALANVKNFEQLSTTMKRLYAVQTTEIGFHSIPPVVIWRDLGYSIPIYFRELAMNIAERLGLEYSEDLYESETDKFFFSVIHAPSVSPDLFSPLSFSPNTPISLIPIPFKGFAGIVFIQSLNETPEEVRNIFYGLIQHRTLAYPNIIMSPYIMPIISAIKGKPFDKNGQDVLTGAIHYELPTGEEYIKYLLEWGRRRGYMGYWNLNPIIYYFLRLFINMRNFTLIVIKQKDIADETTFISTQNTVPLSYIRLSALVYSFLPEGITLKWMDESPKAFDGLIREIEEKGFSEADMEKVLDILREKAREFRLTLSKEDYKSIITLADSILSKEISQVFKKYIYWISD